MEDNFSPELFPEFLYFEKEETSSHKMAYLDKIFINGLREKFPDWFHVDQDISEYAELAGSENLSLILFSFSPKKGASRTKLWNELMEITDLKAKESENPCFFINEKTIGLLVNSKKIETAEKLCFEIAKDFYSKTGNPAISGISYLPCLEYSHSDLVANGLKALVHASMLENEKHAVFNSISLNVSSDDFFKKNDMENAVNELKLARRLDKEDTNVLNSLGVCHAVKKEYDQAAKYFKESSEKSPDSSMPTYNLGLIHYFNDEKEKARKILEKAFNEGSKYFGIPFYLGIIELDLENNEKAMDYFLSANRLKPDNPAVLNHIGAIFLNEENYDKAYENYKKALSIFPQNAHALSALGFIYHKRGENPEIAEAFMKQSTEIEPLNPLFRQRLNLVLKDKK